MDYYYRSALRSRSLSCENRLQQIYCQIKCDVKSALCIQKECYCLTLTSASENIVPNSRNGEAIPDDQLDVEYEDDDEPHMLSSADPKSDKILYALRPALRHHIAHFCPNLDVARECIKKCMDQGKPAFCGKDHVCYCGHRYSHTDDDTGNVKNIYAQFKDLYTKYFGKDMTMDSVELD
ncbi:unnamed protein product [Euphydryas editha]|uniref:Uncharacterized protein n=1 Tax=Euphydryas editha TaxID=104508 RepID=A0AAU9TCJ3_EUPED|nr:unnamed protein product [Euphydryas editha]